MKLSYVSLTTLRLNELSTDQFIKHKVWFQPLVPFVFIFPLFPSIMSTGTGCGDHFNELGLFHLPLLESWDVVPAISQYTV